MKEALKRIKVDVILSAVLSMALGVVLFVWSDQTINAICMVLACGLVVMGAVNLARFFTDRVMNTFSGILGLVLVLVGVWLFARPSYIAVIVPIVIGVILAVHGMGDIRMAWETKQNGYEKWWSAMLLGIVSLAFGVICIVNAFGVVSLAMKFIGVALVYDGISDLWIVSRTAGHETGRIQDGADRFSRDRAGDPDHRGKASELLLLYTWKGLCYVGKLSGRKPDQVERG